VMCHASHVTDNDVHLKRSDLNEAISLRDILFILLVNYDDIVFIVEP
jgi:hypothetical protein